MDPTFVGFRILTHIILTLNNGPEDSHKKAPSPLDLGDHSADFCFLVLVGMTSA